MWHLPCEMKTWWGFAASSICRGWSAVPTEQISVLWSNLLILREEGERSSYEISNRGIWWKQRSGAGKHLQGKPGCRSQGRCWWTWLIHSLHRKVMFVLVGAAAKARRNPAEMRRASFSWLINGAYKEKILTILLMPVNRFLNILLGFFVTNCIHILQPPLFCSRLGLESKIFELSVESAVQENDFQWKYFKVYELKPFVLIQISIKLRFDKYRAASWHLLSKSRILAKDRAKISITSLAFGQRLFFCSCFRAHSALSK